MIKEVIAYYMECENCNKYFSDYSLSLVHVRKLNTNIWTKNAFLICNCCKNGELFGKWKYCEGTGIESCNKKCKEKWHEKDT
jgi:hypothetical protein